MDELHDSIKKSRPDAKDSTIARYVENVARLKKMGGYDNYDFLKDVNVVMKLLDGKAPSTRKAYYNAVIVYLQSKGDKSEVVAKYSVIRDKLHKGYLASVEDGKMTHRDEERWITSQEWSDLIRKLDDEIKEKDLRKRGKQLTSHQWSLVLQHFILSLYFQFPMRNEFAGMKVIKPAEARKITNDDHGNYLVLGQRTSKFIVQDHKTLSSHGIKVEQIPTQFDREIRTFLRRSPNPDYLLVDSKGEPFTSNAFSKYLLAFTKRLTGKAIGSQMLRKIYYTGKYSDIVDDMRKDAEMMGHSVSTAQKMYIKSPEAVAEAKETQKAEKSKK